MADELNLKFGKKEVTIISLAVISIFFFVVFGLTGIKLLIGGLLLFFVPFFLIIDCFEFSTAEKTFFAFFIGLPLFSSAVYMLGFLLGIRLSIAVLFIALMALAVLARKKFKKKILFLF